MWHQELSREEYLKLPREERFIKLSKTEEERAEELHEKLITIDLHAHTWDRWNNRFNLDGVRGSGVTCFLEALGGVVENYPFTVEQIGRMLSVVDKTPYTMRALCAEDIAKAKKEGKYAYMPILEVGSIFNVLERVDQFYGMGIRAMGLTYNSRNFIGDGCTERTDSGLSYFGQEVIARMNDLGMLIDLSHASVTTALEAIEVSKDPVTFSHNGCASVFGKSPKMRTDEEIKALVEKGGVLGIEAVPNVLSEKNRQGILDLLDHVDYAVKLVGADYVGIGTDINFLDHVRLHKQHMKAGLMTKMGIVFRTPFMWGIENPGEWPNITRGLVSRGYSDQEIEKILGGNALRLIKKVIG